MSHCGLNARPHRPVFGSSFISEHFHKRRHIFPWFFYPSLPSHYHFFTPRCHQFLTSPNQRDGNFIYGRPFKWNYSELRGVFSHLFWMRGRGYQFFCTQTRISGEWTVQPFCNLPLGGLFQVFLTRSIQEWSCTHYAIFLTLKYGSQKKNSFFCRCSIFLSPTFVEVKNSCTRTLLTFNSKNFGMICYWKDTGENEPI